MTLNKKNYCLPAFTVAGLLWLFLLVGNVVSAQSDPFADLVNELLWPDSNSVGWGFTNNVSNDWGFDEENIDDWDIEIKQFDDDKLIFTLPVFEKNGNLIEQYAITVLPTTNVEDLFEDDDFYDNIDNYEEKIISPTISDWVMTFALNVADTDRTMYLTIYPVDGDEKWQGIEDFRIDDGDNPSRTDNLTDDLADCLDENCNDTIENVSCNVNEETLRATLRWKDLGESDELEILWKKHTDNNFVEHGTVDPSDETYSVTLPSKTSYLFMLRGVNSNGAKDDTTEIIYLCKFDSDEVNQPAACVWDECIFNNTTTGPESALLLILAITGMLFIWRRLIKR